MNTIWASALLVDNKIKFWKVSPHSKKMIYDFYKEFIYSGESIKPYLENKLVRVENMSWEIKDDGSNRHEIFSILVPKWFSQWNMVENYKGRTPWEENKFLPPQQNYKELVTIDEFGAFQVIRDKLESGDLD